MAYQVIKINPLDLKPSTAIGVSIPFNGNGVFNSTYTTSDQLKSNIINYLLTNRNERIMDPDFGGNLRGFLFEHLTNDTLDEFKATVEESIKRYFPSVSVKEITLFGDADRNNIFMSIKYAVPNTNINDELTLNFTNG